MIGPSAPDPRDGADRMDPGGIIRALTLLAAAGGASLASSGFIQRAFPDRPAPRDLLFEILPYIGSARYLTAVAVFTALALLLIHSLREDRRHLHEHIAVLAVMYLLRAAIMLLTPLANAHGEGAFVFPLVQYGMFPSGHSAAVLLCVRLIDPTRAPGLRRLMLTLAVTVWVALIVSRGHYSIDVVGGVLLAYFVEMEWRHGTLLGPVTRWVRNGSLRRDRAAG